jgi:L-fucose mutarotase
MLKTKLIHGEILRILGQAGHHARILIADGNYPASTAMGPRAQLISLNLSPGVVSCVQVLEALLDVMPFEAATTMAPETSGPYVLGGDPPVWAEYRAAIARSGQKLDPKPVDKWAFYEAVKSPDHVLTIQTGDQQRYANLLLTVGVRMD